MFIVISIHALRVEGDAYPGTKCVNKLYFYPRPPGGGRQVFVRTCKIVTIISIHALRVEGDIFNLAIFLYDKYFYPRPPGGGRHSKHRDMSKLHYFYPRPPGGGRLRNKIIYAVFGQISIHALRVEGDTLTILSCQDGLISIHALRVEGDIRAEPLLRQRG